MDGSHAGFQGSEELDRLLRSERAARAEAEQTLAILQTLAASTPLGFAFFNRELRYVMVNEALAKLHGLAAEAHLGKTVGELFPRSVTKIIEPWLQQVLETGEPMLDLELEVPCPEDPRQVCFRQVSYYPVRTPDGELIGLGVIASDITAHKRAAQEAARRADFAQELIAIVSHDLRSPINAILLSTSALLKRWEPEAPLRLPLERIISAAQRATRMIGDLLDFTRAQVGSGIPVERRPLHFGEFIGRIVDEIQSAHPERAVQVEPHETGEGEWDPDRLAQIVTNLVGNALQHSTQGAPVRVITRGTRSHVELAVWNTGAIPEAELPRLFQPYHRGKRANERAPSGGIGLGLYIARQLVDAHGGRIEVRSSEAQGTTFLVTLPRTGARGALHPWRAAR